MQAGFLQDLGSQHMNKIGFVSHRTKPLTQAIDDAHRKHADGLAAEGGGELPGVFRRSFPRYLTPLIMGGLPIILPNPRLTRPR